MTRVLVTGSGGQLGRSIRALAESYSAFEFLFTDASDMDITDSSQVNRVFQEFGPDYCINCAAFTQVDQAEKEPERAMAVNANALDYLADACKAHHTVLIHISTDYVFDGIKTTGYLPDDLPNPINVYGKSKWEGERIIQQKMKRYFIVRTSWLYSPVYGPNFYTTITEKARQGEVLKITDAEHGCPTRAEHLAAYILDIPNTGRENYGIEHFTDEEPMTWYSFAQRILINEGLDGEVELLKVRNYRTFAPRPKNSVLLKG